VGGCGEYRDGLVGCGAGWDAVMEAIGDGYFERAKTGPAGRARCARGGHFVTGKPLRVVLPMVGTDLFASPSKRRAKPKTHHEVVAVRVGSFCFAIGYGGRSWADAGGSAGGEVSGGVVDGDGLADDGGLALYWRFQYAPRSGRCPRRALLMGFSVGTI
jgi:hypothetical protein